MAEISTANSVFALGEYERFKTVQVRGTLAGKKERIICRNQEISPNALSRIFRLVDGPIQYIENEDTLIILGNESKEEKQKIVNSPKILNGRSKSYSGLFDRVIAATEGEKQGEKKRLENFERMPDEKIYLSLGNIEELKEIRNDLYLELSITSFNTGDDLEKCIKAISENEPLFKASIDKTILAIALSKEYVDLLKRLPSKRQYIIDIENNIENIIAASLLQDYSVRGKQNPENIRGRDHGVQSSKELDGKVLGAVRSGLIHHENHIEEKSKEWEALPRHARIVALANDVYNKAKEGMFSQVTSPEGYAVNLDYKAFMCALSISEPGTFVDELTRCVKKYESLLSREVANSRILFEEEDEQISYISRKNAELKKKVEAEDLSCIFNDKLRKKVMISFEIYCMKRSYI